MNSRLNDTEEHINDLEDKKNGNYRISTADRKKMKKK